MSQVTKLIVRIQQEGGEQLKRLESNLQNVGRQATATNINFKQLNTELKTVYAQSTQSINSLKAFSAAFREVANNTDVTSQEFFEAKTQADLLDQRLAQLQRTNVSLSNSFKQVSSNAKQAASVMRTSTGLIRDPLTGAYRGTAGVTQYPSPIGPAAAPAGRGLGAFLAARGLGGVGGAARIAGGVASGAVFGGAAGGTGALLGALGGPAGIVAGATIGAVTGQLQGMAGSTATYAADLQKQRIALAGLTKDYGEYQNALQRVERLSQQFQIPQEIITRQFTKLAASVIGAGGSLDDTEKAFKGVASGIRGTGGDLQDLSSALTATAQVFSKGKVSAEELRQQIGERLPGAFTLFAQSLGMTPAELDKALEGGKVSLQDFQKFSELLFEKFGKSSEAIVNGPAAAGERLQVQLSKLSENVGKLLAPIGAAFQNVFTEIIRLINGAAVALNKLFKIDLSGEVESLTSRISQLEKAPEGETKRQRQARLRTLNNLRSDLKQATQQRALLSIGAGGDGGPTGLPGAVSTGGGGAKAKGAPDYSVQLANALIAARNELNPLTKIQLEYDAKVLQINESNLKAEKKRVALNDARKNAEEAVYKIMEKIVGGSAKALDAAKERNKQIEQSVQSLEIEAGIIDEKQAREIEKLRFIQQLREKDGQVTEEQLQRINKAYEAINAKNSESMQLFRQIGQNVVSSISDAFMSLFDKAKSLREVLADLLKSTAQLVLQFGLQAGAKSLFPALFANGGIMTGRGPLPLKRYANGGVAYSPQLAMFGEGSTPEAYVPLPDGRSIPVTMKNGGGVGNITVNVDANGSQVEGNQPDANKLGQALGAAVRAELVKQKRPGGLLA